MLLVCLGPTVSILWQLFDLEEGFIPAQE